MNDSREVGGVDVDPESRCAHYHSARDIVAIKFACCQRWYACYYCHQALADHAPQVWPKARFDEAAVRCGHCANTLSIREYIDGSGGCPKCGAAFNPGCHRHHGLYFAGIEGAEHPSILTDVSGEGS